MKGYCKICETEIEVRICCSAFDCGCGGRPIDPPVCSEACYDKYMDESNKIAPNRFLTKLDLTNINDKK